MKCVICKHGNTAPGQTTVTLEYEGTVVVIKSVPAEVCDNCGEAYTDADTTDILLAIARKAGATGVEVQVQHYVAA